MALSTNDIPGQIREVKKRLRQQVGDYAGVFQAVSKAMESEVERIKRLDETGSAIPEFDFADIGEEGFNDEQRRQIEVAGSAVIHNTLPRDETDSNNELLARYIVDNGYYTQIPEATDNYFSQLQSDKPQIFGIYWSKAQIWARQHPNMAELRKHLNRVWTWQDGDKVHFNPDLNLAYADRIRRREPGDASLGLSPHVDSGSIERWLEPNYNHVYHKLFSPNWQDYDAFDGASRTAVEEFPSPAVCSMFRTYQGWVAMTPQGPGDGTLQMVPSYLAVPYMLLRAIQDDVPEDDLCGAAPGRALTVSPEWHPLLLEGLVSIPHMEAGDTVWWHPDTIHAVEDIHEGTGYSNVIYVGAVPDCDKNRSFLPKQKDAFLKGASCPDFAAENYELKYTNRATVDDLTELGKKQMGF
ncbi:DUF1479 domain-containing protein [Parasalinivibrio latis]|uniref:YbiU family protein n=1 Tax=Parasalinivibrio latis TaxID=2952610 RepID=UPI0030E58FBB